ncbi:hypothetical protein [Algoriphagus ratkowskyi]|uniref:Transmembrane protein PGPGW n=2 Tax=Algoriphagus ratkowskyi TaxID=57028 RepID=A0ABY3HPF4_9BACT|nr:hypothetical protein [Algoriphagus ratkowskyi]TXD78289.1 hypothetical protein ESW18_09650 [Algoriphagus ratkowskyi]
MKKFIIPAIAFIVLIIGMVFLFIPFIPIGWLLVAIASLLMAPYFKFMRNFIGWLTKIDKTGFVKKAGEKASGLYEWAGDPKGAEKLEAIIEENTQTDED